MNVLFLTVLFIGISSCRSVKPTPDNLPDNYIKAGSFGGFAGSLTQVFLFPNGSRFKTFNLPGHAADTSEIQAFTKKEFKKLIKPFKGPDTPTSEKFPAGNMNYFVEVQLKDTLLSYRWSDSNRPSASILSLYQSVLTP